MLSARRAAGMSRKHILKEDLLLVLPVIALMLYTVIGFVISWCAHRGVEWAQIFIEP